ncbi:unnamed protein product [Heterosigma akashiwo]|mmetsp:Transcript_14126/g.19485  ORF Transcript_14126/g.19485 Transcript_14126/m.19485 type:complete len:241 (+) Transcript_14126:56-778(+)
MAYQPKQDPGLIGNVVMGSGGASDDWYKVSGSDVGGGAGQPSIYGNATSTDPVGGVGPSVSYDEDYENEPPLLEELGIHFDQIFAKTKLVLNPLKEFDYSGFHDSADLAGPIVFCVVFGFCLLFAGKVQFGYVYGFSLFGCISLYMVLNLISVDQREIDFLKVGSVLGYCLLPIIGLAVVGILFDLSGYLGLALAAFAIVWSTYSSTRLFEQYLSTEHQRWLIAYPVGLLYACFVLITIF